MAMEVFVPPSRYDATPPVNVAFAVHEAAFGDGYKQRAPAGLNSRTETIDLTWPKLTQAQAVQIRAFFDRHEGAKAFLFALFCHQPQRKWTVAKYSYRTSYPHTITASFEEAFEP